MIHWLSQKKYILILKCCYQKFFEDILLINLSFLSFFVILFPEFSREGSQISQDHVATPGGDEDTDSIDKAINRYVKSAHQPTHEDLEENQISSPDSDGSKFFNCRK